MSIINYIRFKIYTLFNISLFCPKNRFIKEGGQLGENCEISYDVEFGSEPYLIKIGNNCRITNGVRFITHDGGVWVLRNMGHKNIDVFGKIEIGNNVNIGWNAIIMPNVKIGNNVVIGAGAVVTKDIPDNSVAVGVPAKVIENIEEYEKKVLTKAYYTKQLSRQEKKEYLLKLMNGK